MRCDVSTCSCAHISLLVSGSAQTCFDDQVNLNSEEPLFFFPFLFLNMASLKLLPVGSYFFSKMFEFSFWRII